jgi:hypothetical protein
MNISFLYAVRSIRDWDDYVELMNELRRRKTANEFILYT